MGKGAAIITGASFGVGRATALALARQGRDVIVTATRAENLGDTLAALQDTGVRALGLPLDLSDPEAPEAFLAEARAAMGPIEVLVNNAATTQRKPATEVTRADWQSIMAVNLEGTFFLSTAFARHCRERGQPGSIVNVASTHGLKGSSDLCLYALSKGAIVHLTKLLAIEWAADTIRVNAVAPGRMLTESPARRPRHRTLNSWKKSSDACRWAGWSNRRRSPPRWPSSPGPTRPPSPARCWSSTGGKPSNDRLSRAFATTFGRIPWPQKKT